MDNKDSPNYFIKDPDAVLDYTVDWTQWMSDADAISSAAWSVPTGITQSSTSTTSYKATIWLSGGTVGQAYQIRCRIVTSGGRTDDRTFTIIVRQK